MAEVGQRGQQAVLFRFHHAQGKKTLDSKTKGGDQAGTPQMLQS